MVPAFHSTICTLSFCYFADDDVHYSLLSRGKLPPKGRFINSATEKKSNRILPFDTTTVIL